MNITKRAGPLAAAAAIAFAPLALSTALSIPAHAYPECTPILQAGGPGSSDAFFRCEQAHSGTSPGSGVPAQCQGLSPAAAADCSDKLAGAR